MPAPNAVKNKRIEFEKFTHFAIIAPRKEVPPANKVVPVTTKISVTEIASIYTEFLSNFYYITLQ